MSVAGIDHYRILGLPSGEEGARLTEREISKAYKLKALGLHPDKRPQDPNAHANFQKLKASYETLMDPDARRRFDGSLRLGQNKGRSMEADDDEDGRDGDGGGACQMRDDHGSDGFFLRLLMELMSLLMQSMGLKSPMTHCALFVRVLGTVARNLVRLLAVGFIALLIFVGSGIVVLIGFDGMFALCLFGLFFSYRYRNQA
ncbi:hypothetical protein Tsubulata_021098 [Turnera subulata]|uniref:J domain-containing protein n=1 Tax=Turnera subulata TaxID=218843 RepID=A0A9Q0GJK4_9ROSI|nr:hypothetical protein Tsubulata_021098 [Turnera subulata]